MECYRGSCYGESVEVMWEEGVACALQLHLIIDGKSRQSTWSYEYDQGWGGLIWG